MKSTPEIDPIIRPYQTWDYSFFTRLSLLPVLPRNLQNEGSFTPLVSPVHLVRFFFLLLFGLLGDLQSTQARRAAVILRDRLSPGAKHAVFRDGKGLLMLLQTWLPIP